MSSPIELVIFGARGNTPEILETIRAINEASPNGPRYVCIGCLDDGPATWNTTVHGIPVIGPLSAARDLPSSCRFINGIGGPASHFRRHEIVAAAGVPDDRFETLVHPTATVASTATIGRGVVLLPHVFVGSYATVGDHVIALPSAVISHDSTVGAHTCMAAAVSISSSVVIGECVYLGTQCAIIGSTRIGARALVGMGSVVLTDVPDETVVVGNPARVLRRVQTAPAVAAGAVR